MGAFYSLGITFDNIENAENCKSEFEKYKYYLSDNTEVGFRIFITKCDYLLNEKEQFTCGIFPLGLELPNANLKLLEGKYFYEIRTSIYTFVKDLKLSFNFAFYEFEGADFVQDNNPIFEILESGYGKIESGEPNGYFLGLYDSSDFLPKRYLDGLVISNTICDRNLTDLKEFENFKEGYLWLKL